MSLTPTLIILAAAAAAAVLANWQERRPREVGETTLVPWIWVQIVAVVVAILMLAHLVSLLTGTPLKSRFGL